MAKKNNWNADAMQGSLISDMEQEVKNGYQRMGQGGGEQAAPVAAPIPQQTEQPQPATAAPAEKPAPSARQDEPTKGVQANLPISLYNRMKRLKFETDESFQSMFQRAMDLFLDVEEGKIVVNKAIKQ